MCIDSFRFTYVGAHGSQKHIDIIHFYNWKDCIHFLRNDLQYVIYALTPRSLDINSTFLINNPASDTFTSLPIESHTFPDRKFAILMNAHTDNMCSYMCKSSDVVFHVSCVNQELEYYISYQAKLAILLNLHAMKVKAMQEHVFQGEKFVIGDKLNTQWIHKHVDSDVNVSNELLSEHHIDSISEDLVKLKDYSKKLSAAVEVEADEEIGSLLSDLLGEF